MKAWQLITHTPSSPTYRRLRSPVSATETDVYGSFRPTEQVALAWERTREIAAVLDAAVIVFQCPRSFVPSRENIRNLDRFFTTIDRGAWLFAWEPRGPDWEPNLIRDICAANRLVHCVDPFESEPAWGTSLYWRLHGRGGYRYRYTDADLADLEHRLERYAGLPGPNYIMFNNISSGADAARFQAMPA